MINGSKMFITNGTQADWFCLLARTTPGNGYKGMSLIIVPTDTPGFSVSKKLKKMGNWSSDTAELVVRQRARAGGELASAKRGWASSTRCSSSRTSGWSARSARRPAPTRFLKMTIEYCRGRSTFGKPLIENQWIYFKLTELITEVEFLRQMCYHCGRIMDRGEDYTREASMAKLKAGRLVREVADTCMQFHGGMGYMEEYPMARYFRDSAPDVDWRRRRRDHVGDHRQVRRNRAAALRRWMCPTLTNGEREGEAPAEPWTLS